MLGIRICFANNIVIDWRSTVQSATLIDCRLYLVAILLQAYIILVSAKVAYNECL